MTGAADAAESVERRRRLHAPVVLIGLALCAAVSTAVLTPVLARPATGSDAAYLLDINAAAASELMLLPRVGPVLAQRIVDDRAAGGPFATIDDLDRVPGIGPRTIERLRPHLLLTPPRARSNDRGSGGED